MNNEHVQVSAMLLWFGPRAEAPTTGRPVNTELVT